jgi:CubicO group peptidase (beta-lactamase class C family)
MSTKRGIDAVAVETFLEQKRLALNLPGLACAIVQGSQIVYAQGFGHAGPAKRINPQTPFILGSLSKSFTALAVMQLAESGVLRLDDPITRHLPWFQMADVRAQSITIRHLLLHTSGISRYIGRDLLSHRRDLGLEETVRALRSVKLAHEPGSTFEYSNTNYAILSLLIEVAAGTSYANYIQQHIFLPLAMQHSQVELPPAQADGLAQGYRWWYGMAYPFDAPYLSDALGAAFFISSAEDMGRWLQLHLTGQVDGVTILNQESLDELHRPQAPTHKTGVQSALGWRVGQLAEEPMWHHGGEVSNFRSDMIIFPDRQIGLVVLANCNNGLVAQLGLDQIAPDLARFLLGLPQSGQRLTIRSFGLLEVGASLALVGLAIWLWLALISNVHFTPGGVVALIVALILPSLALWRLPKLADMPWAGLRLYVPDLGNLVWWLSLLSLVLAGVSLLRWLI